MGGIPLAHSGYLGYSEFNNERTTNMDTLIETDNRSRVVLPGYANCRFLVQVNEDGSLLLQPAVVITKAQMEYDNDPQLRALLSQAVDSKKVIQSRKYRVK